MDEYISKQRAKDLMGCCLASAKAEYKAAKDGLTKARFGDYISTIQSMIDVVGAVESVDVQPVKHGQWNEIYHDSENYSASCSYCQNPTVRRVWFRPYDFCPHCGARMDLKGGEKNG